MEKANTNARVVAEFLADHPKVAKVHYLPFLPDDTPAAQAYSRRSARGAGSTFSFDIRGGQAAAFAFLNALADLQAGGQPRRHGIAGEPSRRDDPFRRARTTFANGIGVLDSTIRLSIGVEHPDDLIADLTQALAAVG